MYYLKYLWMSVSTNVRLASAFRFAFILTILITIIKQFLFLICWKYFFAKYKVVHGWSFDDMLLMYGIVCFSVGVIEVFFLGLKELPTLIENGQLDTYLLQPKNVILNVALSKGDMSAFGEMITGIILMIYSGYVAKAFIMLILMLSMTLLFMFSLLLYLSCFAFFLRNSSDFIRELNLNAMIVVSQPNSAYQGAFKMFTLTLMPVAFFSFFPIEYIRTGLVQYGWLSLFGTVLFFGVACWMFQVGLSRYESGNIIAYRNQ